jgi:hypothetical protein
LQLGLGRFNAGDLLTPKSPGAGEESEFDRMRRSNLLALPTVLSICGLFFLLLLLAGCQSAVSVNSTPPAAPASSPVVSIVANPPILSGTAPSATLSWKSSNATTAQIEPGVGTVSANGQISVSPGQTTTYTIVVSGPAGAASAQATVEVPTAPSQVPPASPVVSAGNDQTLTLPASATLSGTATSPDANATLQLLWSQDSGPGTATFANPASATTTASFDTPGVYVLKLTATALERGLSSSDVVTISVDPPQSFTVVVLPDTQYYSASLFGGRPAMFTAQTSWIAANKVARNIAYVVHLGDIVEHGDRNQQEWENADIALRKLEDAGIPYGLAAGNHDETPDGNPAGTVLFNRYFGVERFKNLPHYGGHYGTDNTNHYDLFSAGGMDFLVLYMVYDPSPDAAVLAWANQVLQSHPGRRAIVVSHFIINGAASFERQGAAIYNALKGNPNLFLMLSGHITTRTEARRQDTFNGSTVYSLMSNYQSIENGGNGYLRILEFVPSANEVRVSTYSPVVNKFKTTARNQFTLPYNMQVQLALNPGPASESRSLGVLQSGCSAPQCAGAAAEMRSIPVTSRNSETLPVAPPGAAAANRKNVSYR